MGNLLRISKPALLPGVTVVIPCLNEAETIAGAVELAKRGIRESGFDGEVVVADNGSTDGSREIANAHGARVVPVAVRGYGAALDFGIQSARYTCCVFGDADLSYPFQELKNLVTPIFSDRSDFVLGSRLGGTIAQGAMPTLNRYLGTPVLSFLIRIFYRMPTFDCNSGMRALRTERYAELRLHCPGMEYASEMLIRASQRKWRYLEVPIGFQKDQRSRPPHLRRWRDGWRHLRFILGNAPDRIVVGLPLLTAFGFMGISLALSFQNLWAPNQPMHYHTAFVALALAVPPLMFALSCTLIRVALHQSSRAQTRFGRWLQTWSERSYPIQASLVSFGIVIAQIGLLLFSWYKASWGDLAEIGGIIRIMLFTILAAAFFALDMGIGLLKIIPYQLPEASLPETAPDPSLKRAV